MKGQEVSLSLDFVRLQTKVKNLKLEVSKLIFEKDNLLYTECKNIEMTYMLELGNLEYKLYNFHVKSLELRRKLELIQIRKNRQEEINTKEINEILDEEFKKYQELLSAQLKSINDAIERSHEEVLSDDESLELKKLYKLIVKSLHPDLNKDVTPEEMELFYKAVRGYEEGSIKLLKVIASMIEKDEIETEKTKDGLAYLRSEKERLENLIKDIKSQIEKIKTSYPYKMLYILEDEDEVERKRQEINDAIIRTKKTIDIYKERLKNI